MKELIAFLKSKGFEKQAHKLAKGETYLDLSGKKIGRVSILQLRLLKSYTFNRSTNNLIMNIQ